MMFSKHSDWLAKRWIARTIYLWANEVKKTFCFALVTEEQILSINEEAVPKNIT